MIKPQLAIIGLLAVALANCGGGGSSNPITASNNGYFRFVNGSADAGAIDIYVDGTKINTSSVAYGQITAYNKFSPGTHTIAVDAAGTTSAIAGIPAAALTQGLNGGAYVSLVLAGEAHPVTASNTLNILAFNDNTFSTPAGGAAVDVRNAATGFTQPVQFGYYFINTPSSSFPIGSAISTGGTTQPFGMPSTALSASIQVGFYANSDTSIVIKPSDFSTSCAANTLPCDSGNYSLYFIDGPAASTSPSAGPYPDEITSSSTAGFVGIVDANGT